MRQLNAILIAVCGLACVSCNVPTAEVSPPPSSASPAPIVAPAGVVSNWPLFRGNAAGQGVAHTSLPAKPKLLWNFKPGDTTFEATAIIDGDTVYVGYG